VGADADELLAELARRPADAELRRRTVEALDDGGRWREALEVLAAFVNLTAHDDSAPLPCLCRRCLPGSSDEASSGGLTFRRQFAVVRSRVLFYWIPAEAYAERRSLRKAVAARLHGKVKA
jgi:hypothetical protein